MMTLLTILLLILTTLKDGMFHTEYETEVAASSQECNMVIDSMIYYLQTDPEKLSENFFGGLGKQSDSNKNAFYLIWKQAEYKPEQKYGKLVLDVLVNGVPFLKDVVVESVVTDSITDNQRDIRVDIHYAGTLLKEAYGTFHIVPTGENTTRIGMDVHVKFGWFFRIFISRKVYSDTIDWRLVRFVNNLKLTAEGYQPNDTYWETLKVEE
jgi:hypothetical protein